MKKFSLLCCFILSTLAFAGDPVAGKKLFATCAACHGIKGEGNAAYHAPTLAGQETWYTINQLANFQAGIRGAHPQDTYGAQMRPMAIIAATPAAKENVAAYIHALPKVPRQPTLKGDAKKGKAIFATCSACHGPQGKGMPETKSPNLTLQQDWYLHLQLQNFRKGVRGADPKDTYGNQMRLIAQTLANDQAVSDVIAYIMTLAQ